MKYVKSFSIFESELNENVKVSPEKVLNKEAKEVVKSEIEKLSDKDKETLKNDLIKLADKLKITRIEDLQDVKKVGDALLAAGMVKESFDLDFNLEVNEGNLTDFFTKAKNWWDKVKSGVYKVLQGFGLTSLSAGIITAAIGTSYMPNVDYLPHNVTVEPNLAIILGGTAAVIGLVSLLVGLKGSGDLKNVGSAAGGARRG